MCCGAPVPRWASSSDARSRATSGVFVRKAWTSSSTASIRWSEDSTTSVAETSPSAIFVASSEPVRSQSSVVIAVDSTIRGTLNRPSSRSGAFESASPCGIEGSGVSSR